MNKHEHQRMSCFLYNALKVLCQRLQEKSQTGEAPIPDFSTMSIVVALVDESTGCISVAADDRPVAGKAAHAMCDEMERQVRLKRSGGKVVMS